MGDSMNFSQKLDLFRFLIQKLNTTNSAKDLKEIITLREFEEETESFQDNELKLIVHSSNLREQIHKNFEMKFKLRTVTFKTVPWDYRSTILTHVECGKSTPFNLMTWYNFKDISYSMCECYEPIYSDTTKFYLSKRHNVLVVTKISGIKCNKCDGINDPDSLRWYNDEDYKITYCNFCSEVINSNRKNGDYEYVF